MTTESTGRPSAPDGFWSVPRMWEGQTVVIIGGGWSLLDFDWERLKPFRCIGCNDAYLLGPEVTDICFFGDAAWFRIHDKDWMDELGRPGLREFHGIVCTNTEKSVRASWVKRLDRRPVGLYKEPWRCAWNQNTGAAAVNLALHTGARKIVLLGFDMKLSDEGNSNYHLNLKDRPSADSYSRFIAGFENLKMKLRTMWPEVTIVNATPGSAMKTFPIVTFEEALCLPIEAK